MSSGQPFFSTGFFSTGFFSPGFWGQDEDSTSYPYIMYVYGYDDMPIILHSNLSITNESNLNISKNPPNIVLGTLSEITVRKSADLDVSPHSSIGISENRIL